MFIVIVFHYVRFAKIVFLFEKKGFFLYFSDNAMTKTVHLLLWIGTARALLLCLSGTARALYLLQLPTLDRKSNHRRYGAPPYHSGKELYLRP